MCGIAGSVNHQLDISKLTKCLYHRGPDEQTTYEQPGLQLHHHRLAILDVAGGKQPMRYKHLTIIFNGEIYNHQDVRTKYNLACTTNSDTETILHSYARNGAACLNDFDGMFAFVIYDERENELFLARDRAGKKPIYYYADGKKLVFASELNAISGQLNLEIDTDNLHQYLRMGYFYKSATPYKNVHELPAGSFARIPLANPIVHVEKWWDIHPFYEKTGEQDF
ncbi:MAG: asparagine synthetase B, partial [Chitinophagaceae bacterium]